MIKKNYIFFFFTFVEPAWVKAGYTTTPGACGWAGAVIEVTRSFEQEQWSQKPQTKVKCDRQTNRPTDGWMDWLTKRGVESRSTRLKTKNKQGRIHGYPSCVRVGRGCFWGHPIIWAGAVGQGPQKKSKVWRTDGLTVGRTNRRTKRGLESRSTRLKTNKFF